MKYPITNKVQLADVFEHIEEKYNLKDIYISAMSFEGSVDGVKAVAKNETIFLEKKNVMITTHISEIKYVELFEEYEVGEVFPDETFGLIQLRDGSSIQLMEV